MPDGIYLTAPHPQWIWSGKKKLIVKSRRFQSQIHKPLVLCGPHFLWGIISLEAPHDISLVDFGKLRNKHLISEEERQKWWPDKQLLYAYQFGFKKFDKPLPWKLPKGVQTFVLNVPLPDRYLRMVHSMKFISDVKDYDPAKVGHKVLLDDHRISHAWAMLTRTRKFKFPLSLVKKIHDAIAAEMRRRKMEHHTPLSESLAVVNKANSGSGPKIVLTDVLDSLLDFRLQAPCAWIVGGLANHGETTGDIDILIRAPAPKGDYDPTLPLRFRILRQLPFELWNRVQFIFDTHSGPYTNAVPLYDLVAVRTDPVKILMSQDDPPPLEDADDTTSHGILIFSTSKLRINDPTIRRMATESLKEDKVKPFRFFLQLKARRTGYRKSEEFSIEGVLEALKKDDYPILVDKKFDGFRTQVHKVGDKVIIWSEDGGRVDRMFPTLVSEVKSHKMDFVLDCEVEIWIPAKSKWGMKGRPTVNGLQHLGRADVSGYAHQKQTDEREKYVVFNAFDCLYSTDYESASDIHNEPLERRRKVLNQIHDTKHLKKAEYKICNDPGSLRKAIEYFSRQPYSEGAMIKPMKEPYPLDATGKFIKYKKEVDLDAQVVMKKRKAGKAKAFIYLCAIRDLAGKLVPVGKTFSTGIDVKVGDILRVTFTTISRYYDRKADINWYNWWAPRPLEHREDLKHPDTIRTADKLVKVTNGEVADKPLPPHFRELKLQADPFLIYPDEKKVHRFVIQHHHRGASVHKDLRMQVDEHLIGWTIADQVKGKVPDVNTLEEARAIDKHWKDPSYFKFQPEFKDRHVFTSKKAPEPIEWLDIQGVVKPGEVGATRFEHGVFVILDKGTVEFGTQKPYFHEYFLHGSKFKGRLVVRQLPKDKRYKRVGRESFFWESWMSKDQTPYVLSTRAKSRGWIPPKSVSALPAAIRRVIPKNLQFWKHDSPAARREARDNLMLLIKSGKIKFSSVRFTLTHKTFKGPEVIRAGPSSESWELMVAAHGRGLLYWEFEQNPIFNRQVSGVMKPRDDRTWLDFEGDIAPGKPGNPTKNTPAHVDIVDKGEVNILEDSPGFKKFSFKGKKLRDLWVAQREKNGKIWVLKRTSVPQTLSFSASFDPSKFERTKDGLLIRDVCALGVGAWKGLGMEFAVWNSPDFIQRVLNLCPEELLLCSEHECFDQHGNLDPSLSIGKAFRFRITDSDLHCDILVTDEKHIELTEDRHYGGFSLNLDTFVCPERRYATDPISVKELTLCVNPACKVCFLPGESCPA